MRSHAAVTVWVVVLLLAFALVPCAGAGEDQTVSGPAFGAGWSLESSPAGSSLVYTPAAPLPRRDARPEFRDGDRLLGYPRERGGRLELPLNTATAAALTSPSVWLSGHRLDGPTPATPISQEPAAAAEPAPRVLSGKEDPGEPGPYTTETLSYELPDLAIEGFPVPVEVMGEVIAPVEAPGPRPLVLFLHGRHDSCYAPEADIPAGGRGDCPEGMLPIPSYLGYRYVAGLLASQGYVTVSISANSINDQDGWAADSGAEARSTLIRHHLALWVGWASVGGDPWGGRFQGAVDLQNVVLVGHSRGGEGIERAAVDATPDDGYRIVGLVPIAPTAFGRQVGAGIPTAVILPYCDGDVSNLEGQQYIDLSRDLTRDQTLRSAVLVLGANHNFFNAEWTPGQAQAPAQDDWLFAGPADDPACGPFGTARLTATEQQAAGATYIAALARVAVEHDPDAASLLDGSGVRAESAGRARVLTHALGGKRRMIYRPRVAAFISTSGLTAAVCRGYVGTNWPPLGGGQVSGCEPGAPFDRLPHWLPMIEVDTAPSPLALELAWWRTGGWARLDLRSAQDISGFTDLDLRVAVAASSPPVDLTVRLIDRRGNSVTLSGGSPVSALRGSQSPLGKAWGQTLRFSLGGLEGIDHSAIIGLELVSRSERGRAWLIDVSARRPGLARPRSHPLPQVSVATLEIPEGGPGPRVEMLPLAIRGEVVRPAVIWVSVSEPEKAPRSYRLVLPAGTTEAAIPITVEGNDQYDPGMSQREYRVALKALSHPCDRVEESLQNHRNAEY